MYQGEKALFILFKWLLGARYKKTIIEMKENYRAKKVI
jgi:hypothetical protein